jgi:hypothetical protein
MRPRPRVSARTLAGVVAAFGILCAATTTIWPTKIVVLRTPEVGDFTKGFEHRIWSWGREAVYSSDGVPFRGYSGPVPTLSLVFLVLVLVLGAAGAAVWLLLPGRRGEVLGVTGTALAASAVVQSVVARLAFDDRTLGLQPGLVVVTPVAGWLQYAAACLLVAALLLMLVQLLVPDLLPSIGRTTRRLSRTAAERAARGDDDLVPRRSVAVIRDVSASEATSGANQGEVRQGGARQGGARQGEARQGEGDVGPGAGDGVGFSDRDVD